MILMFLKQANPSSGEYVTPPLPLQIKGKMAAFMIFFVSFSY